MVARVARYVFDRAAREGNASNTQAVNGPPFEIGAVDDFHVEETCEVVETGNGRVKIGISQETICWVPVHRRLVRDDGRCLDDHKSTVPEKSPGNGKAGERRIQVVEHPRYDNDIERPATDIRRQLGERESGNEIKIDIEPLLDGCDARRKGRRASVPCDIAGALPSHQDRYESF